MPHQLYMVTDMVPAHRRPPHHLLLHLYLVSILQPRLSIAATYLAFCNSRLVFMLQSDHRECLFTIVWHCRCSSSIQPTCKALLTSCAGTTCVQSKGISSTFTHPKAILTTSNTVWILSIAYAIRSQPQSHPKSLHGTCSNTKANCSTSTCANAYRQPLCCSQTIQPYAILLWLSTFT